MGATGGIRPAASRTPNYVSRLEHRVAWPEFPLKVAFVKDAELKANRDSEAVAGFRQWEAATDGLVRFIVVDDPSRAQVLVSFNPLSNDGATTNSFARGEMIRAEMKIGVKGGRGADIACVAAHEFGHALGITGHSEDRKDLMYPYHWMGKGCGISERDLNTLSDRYPALAARLVNEKAAALASR